MSYIFERLKKSGKKREIELQMQKQLQRDDDQQRSSEGMLPGYDVKSVNPRKQFAVYLVLTIFLLNASLFIWWLYPRLNRKTEQAGQPPSVLRNMPVLQANTQNDVAVQIPLPSVESSKSVINADEKRTVSAGKTPRAAGLASQAETDTGMKEKGPTETLPLPSKPQIRDGIAQVHARLSDQRKEAPQPSVSQILKPDIGKNRTETGDGRHAVEFAELPLSVRKKLPQINISSHLYSIERKSRLVSINGRIMQEGYNLPDGLYLDEITRDGVILDYQGYRFHVKTN